VIAVWIPVTVVPKSSATVAIAVFITVVSRAITNWPVANVSRTMLDAFAAIEDAVGATVTTNLLAVPPRTRGHDTCYAASALLSIDQKPRPDRRDEADQRRPEGINEGDGCDGQWHLPECVGYVLAKPTLRRWSAWRRADDEIHSGEREPTR